MNAVQRESELSATEAAILEELGAARLEYVALIAARRGLHPGRTRERCRALAERGLIERVSAEVVYRITAAGERRLAERRPPSQ